MRSDALDNDTFALLAKIALAMSDTSGTDRVCAALESGKLTHGSAAPTRAAIAKGNMELEGHIRSLQKIWKLHAAELSGRGLGLLLRTSIGTVDAFRRQVAATQVVWTGPKVEGSFLRATREVVRELIRGAKAELLVVGYWIAARNEGEGIVEEIIASLAEATTRGVKVSVVLDERVRSDGRDNRTILTTVWPNGVPLPKLLTWHLPPFDEHLKLHAKVLVADRQDALITSANLTFHAMDLNMEMGVRIDGRPAADIAKHFDLLTAKGIIEP